MALFKLRCINLGDIAAGASAEKEFSPPEDWHVKKVHITDRNGGSLYNVQVYIKLPSTRADLEDLITDDYAPARLFHPESRNQVVIDRDVPKGARIYIKATNNESSTVNLDVCFELEAPSS